MNTELIDVVRVVPLPNYQLELTFANHEVRVFDMTVYLHKKPFNQLTEPNRFMTAHVDCGTVVWAGNIDISPETLYDRSLLLAGRSLPTLVRNSVAAPVP
jgi:hypothetical protein